MYKFFSIPYLRIIGIGLLVLLLNSCLMTRNLPTGEKLYTGYSFRINGEEKLSKEGQEVVDQISEVIQPRPNSKTLFIFPIKLWIYNLVGKPMDVNTGTDMGFDEVDTKDANKGVAAWIRTNMGEPPVLRTKVYTAKINELLKNRLENMGYLHSRVFNVDIPNKRNSKKVKIRFDLRIDSAYKVGEVRWPPVTNQLTREMDSINGKSLLVIGKPYNLNTLRDERDRIDKSLKELGYYYFSPDFLLFKIDSANQNHTFTVQVAVKPGAPADALIPYSVNDIYITQATQEDKTDSVHAMDTVKVDGCYYMSKNKIFKPRAITNAIEFEQGQRYTSQANSNTLRNFTKLDVFKFMHVTYKKKPSATNGLFDMYIELQPSKRRSFSVDVDYITKSNGFAGPGASVSYLDRNVLGGAERLQLKLDGGFENQISGETTDRTGNTSYELGANMSFTVPGFFPIATTRKIKTLSPQTRFEVDFSLTNQVQYLKMATSTISYGYNWSKGEYFSYQVNLASITYQHLVDSTHTFHLLLERNSLLKRSFENQFIFGSIYSATYNTTQLKERHYRTWATWRVDLSGNLVYLGKKSFGAPLISGERYYFINNVFAQYVRTDFDWRQYFKLTKTLELALRTFGGVGVPLGNSDVLPYVKQYFAGGANGIRAFAARSIGPGSYKASYGSQGVFIDKTGNVKLEANLEFRWKLSSLFELAFFTDAGNVWLLSKDIERPGAALSEASILQSCALGSGLGLRLDASFFIVRFDVGFPLRRPDMTAGQKWFYQNTYFKGLWKPAFNLAIGYPF